jgi:hypothetical protein
MKMEKKIIFQSVNKILPNLFRHLSLQGRVYNGINWALGAKNNPAFLLVFKKIIIHQLKHYDESRILRNVHFTISGNLDLVILDFQKKKNIAMEI